MKTNCEFCGSIIDDTDVKCSNCGAVNSLQKSKSSNVPVTIEQLKKWYQDNKLPPENITRFFIGKDIKEPKAWGIYHDKNMNAFVVYENRADGKRYCHYDGGDEAYAVNELFQKIKEVIARVRSH